MLTSEARAVLRAESRNDALRRHRPLTWLLAGLSGAGPMAIVLVLLGSSLELILVGSAVVGVLWFLIFLISTLFDDGGWDDPGPAHRTGRADRALTWIDAFLNLLLP